MDDVLNGARAACEERTTALCALRAIEVLDGDQVANSDQQTAISAWFPTSRLGCSGLSAAPYI